MLLLIIAIIVWGILGFAYTFTKKLDRFDIPISAWIIIVLILEYLVCIKGIGII